jgi:hypothetical protein
MIKTKGVRGLFRPLFLLSMLAALAGTPLRLAEAAHDIACALPDHDRDSAIEIPDGGVGDDSDATVRADVARPPTIDSSPNLIESALIARESTVVQISASGRERRPPRALSKRRAHALVQRLLC